MKFRFACLALASLALSSCTTTPKPSPAPPAVTITPRVVPSCRDCGRIEKIETVQVPRAPVRTGAVLGGVVGGVLSDPGKAAAPSAAPATQKTYRLTVRMDDGRRLVLNQNVISPNLRLGSVVRVNKGRVVLMR